MANPQEHELTYVLGDTLPALGQTLEIAPGIRWLRMGLPFALDHINLWLVRDTLDGREGWTIVDCGISNDSTRTAWEQVFAEALEGLPVLRVIVTHMHPDHIGLAHWLTERWSTPEWPCRLWISLTDWNAARMASLSTTGFGGEAAATFFASHGVTDPTALDKVRQRGNYYSGMVPQVPRQFRRMMEGQRLTLGGHVWTCHAGHGHAPEHISLHCEALGVLISGDMVLPRISTNISVIDIEPEGDPLPLYLASIERMRKLPADTLVLPSHGKPFRGLHPRITQLQDHHTDRLADVMAACAVRPHSAFEILPVLFKRPLDLHQLTFALGEALAHLHALWLGGDLQRVRQADGVWRFAAV
jgi:glyoxylase-like metal-dependent hydrolase (beta-lactamase superfamily II)